MKRCFSMILALCMTLSLAACAPEDSTGSASASQSAASSSAQSGDASLQSEDSSVPVGFVSLNRKELVEVYDTVYLHYDDAGLPVMTLTEINPQEGEVAFHVAFQDEGEADRTIELSRQDGQWVVVSEGH